MGHIEGSICRAAFHGKTANFGEGRISRRGGAGGIQSLHRDFEPLRPCARIGLSPSRLEPLQLCLQLPA